MLFQGENTQIRLSVRCQVQGDVVLECIHISDNLEKEEVMFKAMLNTAFVQSNSLLLNRDELDVSWNSRDQFPRDFRVEVCFSFLLLNMQSTFVVLTFMWFVFPSVEYILHFSRILKVKDHDTS